jgi:hypothetical protein
VTDNLKIDILKALRTVIQIRKDDWMVYLRIEGDSVSMTVADVRGHNTFVGRPQSALNGEPSDSELQQMGRVCDCPGANLSDQPVIQLAALAEKYEIPFKGMVDWSTIVDMICLVRKMKNE